VYEKEIGRWYDAGSRHATEAGAEADLQARLDAPELTPAEVAVLQIAADAGRPVVSTVRMTGSEVCAMTAGRLVKAGHLERVEADTVQLTDRGRLALEAAR
jgi:hypothetical protein